MSALDTESLPAGLLTAVEETIWPDIKAKLAPIVWSWYSNHKDDKVTTLFKVYTVTVSSFGLVDYALTEIFGTAPVA